MSVVVVGSKCFSRNSRLHQYFAVPNLGHQSTMLEQLILYCRAQNIYAIWRDVALTLVNNNTNIEEERNEDQEQ